jgi:hypothetical protein
MKKMAIVLGVLIATSLALAGVDITATHEGNGVVRIDYASDANVSAFALEVTVNNGVISSISNYHTGDCNATNKGHGIFPGNFNRYIDANNPNWSDPNYTPVADPCDPGAAGTGLGTGKIIIEMGALYEDSNKPPLSGTLFKINCSNDCNLSVVANALRGKVVLTDFSEVDPNVAGATNIPVSLDCFPSNDPCYATWVAIGKPECWCYYAQCYGDADGLVDGGPKVGGYYHVGSPDLTALATCWKKKYTSVAEANCVNYTCADFDHAVDGGPKVGGYYRVGSPDLTILATNWKKKGMAGEPNCVNLEDCGGTLGQTCPAE